MEVKISGVVCGHFAVQLLVDLVIESEKEPKSESMMLK